jgi:hypothetical protein
MPPARVQVSAARLCVAVLERPKWAATALREAHATLHRVRKNKLPAAARVVHAAEDARLHLAGRMADALQRVPSPTPHPTPLCPLCGAVHTAGAGFGCRSLSAPQCALYARVRSKPGLFGGERPFVDSR